MVVWKFDRFARSLRQLLHALELFRTLGVGFVSCTEAIDTSLPHGEMLFQIIGAIAQYGIDNPRGAATVFMREIEQAINMRPGKSKVREFIDDHGDGLRAEMGQRDIPLEQAAALVIAATNDEDDFEDLMNSEALAEYLRECEPVLLTDDSKSLTKRPFETTPETASEEQEGAYVGR